MDEFKAVMKAREFVAKIGSPTLPVSVDRYAEEIDGSIKKTELGENEDAWSVRLPNGTYRICVNCAHNGRRQRFSVCHEVAHAVLEIPADHTQPSWRYTQKPQGEIYCDVFAAELLLPYKLLKPRIDAMDMGFAAIDLLATEFDASLISTASRFATFSRGLCAFVLSEGGRVRYNARSTALRDARAWVKSGSSIPEESYSARVRAGERPSGFEKATPDRWFVNWERDGTLYEDVIHLESWDQTLTLLLFEDDEVPPLRSERKQWEEQSSGLAELDGILPWPGRRKRR